MAQVVYVDNSAVWQPLPVAFPIDSVFVTFVNQNPATFLGFGTWSSLASGAVIIGGGTPTLLFWRRTA